MSAKRFSVLLWGAVLAGCAAESEPVLLPDDPAPLPDGPPTSNSLSGQTTFDGPVPAGEQE